MTDEEKKRQRELDGSVSKSITQPAHTQDAKQPDAASQSQQEAEQSQKKIQSDSGASIGRRTSTGTILNYDPSADVSYQNAIQALKEVQQNAPAYTDSYAGDLSALYEKIVNRAPFRYDINGDPLYQQYKDEYLKGGRLSMMDTMGQAAALTGGYGSTYSQRSGQQAYDAYVQQLNSVIPDLYDRAYGRWQDEGTELYRQYGLLGDRRDDEYARYQDDYNRWMQQVQLAKNDADDAYERGLGDWQREYKATMDKAETLAGTGDFSVYAELYGKNAADSLFKAWKFKNPMLAYQSGYIDAEGYKAITGSYPPGYKAPGRGYYAPAPADEPEQDDDISEDGNLYPNRPTAVAKNGIDLINQGYSYTEVQDMIKAAAKAGEFSPNEAQTALKIIQQNENNKKTTFGGRH